MSSGGFSLMPAMRVPIFTALGQVTRVAPTIQLGRREGESGNRFAERTYRTGGTLDRMHVDIHANNTNGTITQEIYTGASPGTASGLKVDITAATTGEFEDLTTRVAIAPGTIVWIRNDGSAVSAGGSFAGHTWFCRFRAADSTKTACLLMAVGGPEADASTTTHGALCAFLDFGDVLGETDSRTRLRAPFTARDMGVHVETNGRSTTTNYRLRIDGANGNSLVAVTGATTGEVEDTSNTDAISSGQDVQYERTTGTGTGTIETSQVSIWLISDTKRFVINAERNSSGNAYTPAASETNYWNVVGQFRDADIPANEAEARGKIGVDCTVEAMSLHASVNGITAPSTVTLRKNAVATSIAVTMAASTTGWFENIAATADFLWDDDATYEFAMGATGTNAEIDRAILIAEDTESGDTPTLRTIQSGLRAA